MLDKARNKLIVNAFRKANITSLESAPTAAEIEDAAHTLNVMLQSWNNDGFRLFKIKTGYLPFVPGVNEYSLATQAYKDFEAIEVSEIQRIGATKIELKDLSNIAANQKLIVVNNSATLDNSVVNVDYKTGVVSLSKPLSMGVYEDDTVFYGNFNTAITTIKHFNANFDTIDFSGQSVMPAVGDIVYFCYNTVWCPAKVYSVNSAQNTITFETPQSYGDISSAIIVYGKGVYKSTLAKDYEISARKLIVSNLTKVPTYVALPSENAMGDIKEVESVSSDKKEIFLTDAVSDSVLALLGVDQIKSSIVYPSQTEVLWSELSDLVPAVELDWGSISDSSNLVTDDWGFITDIASELIDWGTLSGTATIRGFSESNGYKYVLAQSTDNDSFSLFVNNGQGWSSIDISSFEFTSAKLYTVFGKSWLYDINGGLYSLIDGVISPVFSNFGIETIISYQGLWYLVSGKISGITRNVSTTSDFVSFSSTTTILLGDVKNPAEFLGKIYIGSTDTYVGNMQQFNNINVYSQSRCVIGDRLLNLNTAQVCSYTKDGVNFYPMPLSIVNQTSWGYKDGCSFIAVYGILENGIVGTQIFTANDFNPVWTPQCVVPGRVFDIFFDGPKAYFVSDVCVMSLSLIAEVVVNKDIKSFALGEQIGRPQELMNVIKYSFLNMMQLPMNALALKDFLLLPNGQDGEPVNYCFMREAEDGKMMVWGTPNKFGEYLKFSYVEPLSLLEDARSTPDFPDEYYEAVEDGLAAQLASDYGLPLDRQQALVAKAQESKENAILHDNEDTSYDMMPNQRWL